MEGENFREEVLNYMNGVREEITDENVKEKCGEVIDFLESNREKISIDEEYLSEAQLNLKQSSENMSISKRFIDAYDETYNFLEDENNEAHNGKISEVEYDILIKLLKAVRDR